MTATIGPCGAATWPSSQALLAEHCRRRILHDNVAELYRLSV